MATSSNAHPRAAIAIGLALSTITIAGCSATHVSERDHIADRAMAFDEDATLSYLRNKIEAAREGAFGGFGAAAAGGCGCQ